jgi:hypothetical protein
MYNSVQWRIIARELARTGGAASQAARNLGGTSPAFNASIEATSLAKLFGPYAKGLQTLLRK